MVDALEADDEKQQNAITDEMSRLGIDIQYEMGCAEYTVTSREATKEFFELEIPDYFKPEREDYVELERDEQLLDHEDSSTPAITDKAEPEKAGRVQLQEAGAESREQSDKAQVWADFLGAKSGLVRDTGRGRDTGCEK